MFKKRLLMLIMLFVVFFYRPVCAGANSGVYISEEFQLENINREQSFFLFSSGEVTGVAGDVYVLFSKLEVGDFTGRIFSFFSEVRAREGTRGSGTILSFSSRIYYPVGAEPPQPLLKPLSIAVRMSEEDRRGVYDDTIPQFAFSIFLSVVLMLLVFLIAPFKRSFFEQSGFTIVYEPFKTIRNGLYSYIILLSLTVVFLFSIVGFPVALTLGFVMYCLSLAGEAALATVLGYFILESFNMKKYYTYSNMLTGVIIIELSKSLPYVGNTLRFVFLPITAIGAVSTGTLNWLCHRKFYDLPYGAAELRPSGDMSAIRKIILGEEK